MFAGLSVTPPTRLHLAFTAFFYTLPSLGELRSACQLWDHIILDSEEVKLLFSR